VALLTLFALGWAAAPAEAFVYWTDLSTRTIGRANLDGTGANQSFIASPAYGIAVDAAHVYWANFNTGAIGRANLDGTGATPSFIIGASFPLGVAVDAGHIYWTNSGAGTIGRANLDGTGADQSFITGASQPRTVAVDAAHVYWTNNHNPTPTGEIGRANLDGTGADQSFITGATLPVGVAVDAAHVYWANNTTAAGEIGRANLDGTGADQRLITGIRGARGLAADAAHIYWANSDAGTIGRANLDGTGADQSYITGASAPNGVAVDALGPSTPGLAPPVLAKAVNVAPASGKVFVSVPAGGAFASLAVPGIKGRTFVPLTSARQIPVGSLVDTRRGSVSLTSASAKAGQVFTGTFSAGVFAALQARSGLTDLTLKGASFRPCATGKRASAALSRRAIRRIHGNARGRFRTRGRYSAATVRGTVWDTIDRCDGTLTKVKRGTVIVHENREPRCIAGRRCGSPVPPVPIRVGAGKSYLAKAG
jgi:sugar lactone lactonase YvrE